MRKIEREITDFSEIVRILKKADTLRLGINGSPYPYVVPMSFGIEAVDDKITIYIHGARDGFKHELISADNHVCVEADILNGYAEHNGSVTALYESVIGYGRAEIVSGAEVSKGLDLLLDHCGYAGFSYNTAVLRVVRVYKIVLENLTGKRHTI
jgi:nitroimidazol reductase NimA-like FMN-containing flavoprotein (pyridoxamine 5'-phosphate oxidase superfamily)